MKNYVTDIYTDRFDKNIEQRDILWKILCKDFFQKFINQEDTVLDLAAGYCEFINNIEAKNKIAVDLNPQTKKMANKGIKVYEALSTKLPKELTSKVDKVFTSNFFEHLDSKDELMATLQEVNRVLKVGGEIMVLQPNIKLVGGEYWDFVDHTLPVTEKSLAEALELNGFKLTYQKTRFLPYTASAGKPIVPLFVKLYLRLPIAHYFMGKQTFMVATKI
jgi:ubiquinone/menaquinone biosynthesis C-methylase UbiE